MTQTGKCDTCRQRKVKCNEERPKCDACKKKDRPCTYSYGKLSAFVVQDPKQLTKHGKSKTEPIMYSLNSDEDQYTSSPSTPSGLHITTQRNGEGGHGSFLTLAPVSKSKARQSKKKANYQKRTLEAYLQHLQKESAVVPYQPCSPETTLVTRYMGILGTEAPGKQPLLILGTWILSIPARIGSNTVLDLAVEFLINSYAAYRDRMHSKQQVAKISKAKALRKLQLAVLNTQSAPTYDVLLATKIHFAAEALSGLDRMYHVVHAFGLTELLKSGRVSDVDDEHFWSLVDNTYIDDVNEALLTGRDTVYSNEFYLSATYPPPLNSASIFLSAYQRASMAIMHVFIQCPRAASLIRHAITNPEDTKAIATAMSYLESLFQVDISKHASDLIQTAITVAPSAPSPDVADLMPNTLAFDSVQSMVLCTRYWMLQNVLCGFADTLYRHFPAEATLSLLPRPEGLHVIDTDSALHLAKSIRWADSICQRLPLVPLRLHTPLQISIGPWHRTIRNIGDLGPEEDSEADFCRAERMKTWLIEQCNRVHRQWGVALLDEKPLLEALDCMAGEVIPEWLPVRVRFEAEDGEMVMKLDYEDRTGIYSQRYGLDGSPDRNIRHHIESRERCRKQGLGAQELPPAAEIPASDNDMRGVTSWSNEAVDFQHSTRRNLPSPSGWWAETSTTATVELENTYESPSLSQIHQHTLPRAPPTPGETRAETTVGDAHSHISSSWPHPPNPSSTNPPSNTPIPPSRSTPTTITFNNEQKNACFSPAWRNTT